MAFTGERLADLQNRRDELRRRRAAGTLTPEEEAELRELEAEIDRLEARLMISPLTDDDHHRLAELRRRQAEGTLTAEEEAELRQLEVRLGVTPLTAAEMSRLAELERRRAEGRPPLTAEELAELERLQGRLGLTPITGDDMDRLAELKRRQAAGELTAAEQSELALLEARMQVKVPTGWFGPAQVGGWSDMLKETSCSPAEFAAEVEGALLPFVREVLSWALHELHGHAHTHTVR